MRRITRVEMDWLVGEITTDATTLNLLPLGAKVCWVPGNISQGHAPQVPVVLGEHNQGRAQVSFLPEFGYRDTTRDAHKALTATYKALSVLAARERR